MQRTSPCHQKEFDQICHFAHNQDVKGLEKLIAGRVVTINVLVNGDRPISKLARDGDHQAVEFLANQFNVPREFALYGYAASHQFDKVKELIERGVDTAYVVDAIGDLIVSEGETDYVKALAAAIDLDLSKKDMSDYVYNQLAHRIAYVSAKHGKFDEDSKYYSLDESDDYPDGTKASDYVVSSRYQGLVEAGCNPDDLIDQAQSIRTCSGSELEREVHLAAKGVAAGAVAKCENVPEYGSDVTQDDELFSAFDVFARCGYVEALDSVLQPCLVKHMQLLGWGDPMVAAVSPIAKRVANFTAGYALGGQLNEIEKLLFDQNSLASCFSLEIVSAAIGGFLKAGFVSQLEQLLEKVLAIHDDEFLEMIGVKRDELLTRFHFLYFPRLIEERLLFPKSKLLRVLSLINNDEIRNAIANVAKEESEFHNAYKSHDVDTVLEQAKQINRNMNEEGLSYGKAKQVELNRRRCDAHSNARKSYRPHHFQQPAPKVADGVSTGMQPVVRP